MEKNITGKVHSTTNITTTNAQKLINFGLNYATNKQLNIAIAVVDNSGHLLAFARMDNASLVTIEVAIGKAKSAAYLKAPSKLFEDFVNQGVTSMLNVPNILPLQGGVPLIWQGQIVGAVGVSGADGDTDRSIAEQIARVFEE